MSTHPDSWQFSPGTKAVPLIRGYLAAAIDLLPSTSDTAMEVCGVWSDLDEITYLPTIDDVPTPPSALEAMKEARALIRYAVFAAKTPRQTLAYARAFRRLDDIITTVRDAAQGSGA